MSSLNDVIDAALGHQDVAEACSGGSPRLKAALRLLLAPKSVEENIHPDDTIAEPAALQDLVARFEEGGYGRLVQSWLSTEDNEPLEPDQVAAALGAEKIVHLANRTGLPQDRLLGELASLLPAIIDALTPQGAVPTSSKCPVMGLVALNLRSVPLGLSLGDLQTLTRRVRLVQSNGRRKKVWIC